LGVVSFGLTVSTGLIDSQRVIERAAQVGSTDYQGLVYRYQEAVGAWEGFRQSPVFGQGLGYAIPTVFTDNGLVDSGLFIVHDFYMYVPLKFGVIGIPVFLGFLVSMVRTATSTYRQAKEPFDRAFAAGLASLLIALLVESITSSRFTDRTSTALLAILVACLLSIRREVGLGALVPPVHMLVVSQGGPATLTPSPSGFDGRVRSPAHGEEL
jgi:O-antigen ligase